MTSTAEIRNGTCVVTMAGEFDRANVDRLAEEIESCLESATSVIFDFGAVSFINGAVMSLLQSVVERLNGGALAVARPIPRIENLLRVAGFPDLPNFHIFRSVEEAIKGIGSA